ncbi:MAG: VWA domain-containing protein [Acidobacteriaceae bacterium]
MRAGAASYLAVMGLALVCMQLRAQETQAEPTPVTPTPKQSSDSQSGAQTTGSPPSGQPATAAPVERRRVAHPNAGSTEPVAGPLTGPGKAAQGTAVQTPVTTKNGSIDEGTIRVETRLVNVAVNVVDAHGAPVGGFEKKDFELYEDGRQQTIAVYEREATSPLSIVLAIDASETVVTSERLEREAAKHFVTAILRPQDEICLMEFADTVREVVPFTNQAKRIEEGLGNMRRGEETALYNAVYLASQRLATTSEAAGRRRVLVLISDGGDSIEHGVRYEEAVEEAQRAGAIVYSIIVVPIAADAGRNTGGEHTLIQMSEDTGGKYYYVADPKDLEPAFSHISDDLRTQYLLGYYAPEGGDGGFRRIKVKLTDPAADAKYNLRYRTGYFADSK